MNTEHTKSGVMLIAEERQRQREEKGWTPEHDDKHSIGELCSAAGAYLFAGDCLANAAAYDSKYACTPESLTEEILEGSPVWWPWEADGLKIGVDPVQSLAKAGALIAAEIDRLLRLKGKEDK